MTVWTHDQLAEDLADYLRLAKSQRAWTNMPMGPAGSVRPDVFTLGPGFTRFCPISYEVKISQADFRADVTAHKWADYLAFSAGVVFAAPAGVLSKADIPEGCGLWLRTETGWRTVRAPKLRPVDNLPRDAWIKLLFDGLERLDQDRRQEPRQAQAWKVAEQLRTELGADVAAVLQNREKIAEAAQKVFSALRLVRPAMEPRDNLWHLHDLAYHVSKVIEI